MHRTTTTISAHMTTATSTTASTLDSRASPYLSKIVFHSTYKQKKIAN